MPWYFVDDHVAIAPKPQENEINVILRSFDLIVVLDKDLINYFKVGEGNIKLVIEDVDEGSVPHILRSYELVRQVVATVRKGGKVLILCTNGMSRSPTLAILYLILKGLSFDEAEITLKVKRGLIHLTQLQRNLGKVFNYVLNLLTPRGVEAIYVFGRKFEFGGKFKHLSLSMEYSVLLVNAFRKYLGLSKVEEVVAVVSSALHDIGYKYGVERHHVKSFELIRNSIELYSAFGSVTREAIAWTAYHHTLSNPNPLLNNKISEWAKESVAKATAILHLANVLAKYESNRLVNIDVSVDNELILVLTWYKFLEDLKSVESLIRDRCSLLMNLLGVKDVKVIHDSLF